MKKMMTMVATLAIALITVSAQTVSANSRMTEYREMQRIGCSAFQRVPLDDNAITYKDKDPMNGYSGFLQGHSEALTRGYGNISVTLQGSAAVRASSWPQYIQGVIDFNLGSTLRDRQAAIVLMELPAALAANGKDTPDIFPAVINGYVGLIYGGAKKSGALNTNNIVGNDLNILPAIIDGKNGVLARNGRPLARLVAVPEYISFMSAIYTGNGKRALSVVRSAATNKKVHTEKGDMPIGKIVDEIINWCADQGY